MQMNDVVLRELGDSESYFWLSNLNSWKHFVVAAELSGQANDEEWRVALQSVQDRHPLLRAYVAYDDNGRLYFYNTNNSPIPMEVCSDDSLSWEVQMAKEISTPLPLGTVPLARAALLRLENSSMVFLALHHSIADGLSASFIMRDLLLSLSGSRLPVLPVTIPQEDLCLSAPEQLPIPSSGNHPPATVLDRDGREPHVQALKLSKDLTGALRLSARRRGATVHGALVAALAIAGREMRQAWQNYPSRIVSPVDNRKLLGLEDECALSIVFPIGAYSPKSRADFWQVALDVKRDLSPIRTEPGLSAVFTGFRDLMSQATTVDQIAAFEVQACACEGMVSNLGVLPFKTDAGTFKLLSLWGPSVFVGIEGEQMIGAATVNDAIHLLHTSYTPIPGLLACINDLLEAMVKIS